MRALIRRCDRSDRGAVLPFVGLLLVALLGMGALVIDGSAIYQERRELQNGADAAALAVAADCAGGDCDDGPWGPGAESTAQHFADENAEDGASAIDEVCGDGPGLVACGETPDVPEGASGWVKVTPATNGQIDFVLAPVLDAALDGKTLHASAIAAWGPAGGATTLPLIFSVCEFETFGGRLDPIEIPEDPHVIYFHDTTEATPCHPPGSGFDLPGGFGWLENSGCEVSIDEDGWVGDDTGNDVPRDCRSELEKWRDQVVLIPLFKDTNDLTGANGEYQVAGFVGFRILGYNFPGDRWWSDGVERCDRSQSCIYGEFTEVTVPGDEFGEHDFGARIVKMIG